MILGSSIIFLTFLLQALLSGTLAQLTLPSNQITLQAGFTFHYEFLNDAQTVRMGLQINRNVDYFAVGFSQEANSGMRNFDIVAFLFNPTTNAVQVQDLYSTTTARPPLDTSRGGTSDYTLIDSYVNNGIRQVLFQRPYNTGDQNDYTFSSDQDGQNLAINWAWLINGLGTLAYHGNANRGTLVTQLDYNLPPEEVPEENPPEENPPEENPPEENPPEENPPEENPPEENPPEENPPEENPPEENPPEENPDIGSSGLQSSLPLTFPNKRVSLQNNGLVFFYEILRETNKIRMGLEIERNVDYFSVGFGEQGSWGMEGFDIVAFIFFPSSTDPNSFTVQVQDLYATEYSHPPSDISLGGKNDYRLIQYYAANGKRQVIFERDLSTGDIYDYTFRPELNGTETAVSWAWNSYDDSSLYYHDGNRGTLLIDMSLGDDDQDPQNEFGSPIELTFPLSKVYIPNGGLTFYFNFNDETQIIQMGLEINRPVDFFGLGFADQGNSGMENFDIAAFTFIPSASMSGAYTVMVHDLYSTDNSRPPSDTSRGGSSDYKLVNYYAANGKRQVLFERPYNTQDVYDYTFHPERREANIAISWAWAINGQGSLSYHGRQTRGTVLTQMYNGLDGVGRNYFTGINSDLFFKYHAYLFLAIWGVLIDIAIWIARYKKASKYYITTHMIMTSIIYVGTVILTAIALKLKAKGVMGSEYEAHLALGISILVLSTLQVLIGFAFRFKIVSSSVTKTIAPLSKIHMVMGILTYLLSKAQLIIGLNFYQPDYVGILGAVYAGLFICWIAYDYFFKHGSPLGRRKAKILPKGDSNSKEHQILLGLLNKNTPVSEILQHPDLKRLQWAILDNKVFELKNFTHPGGNFILKQIHGREVGRFIYGVAGLESFIGNSQHVHTKQALSVVRKNFIGTITNENQVLVPTSEASPQSQIQNPMKANHNWSLLKKVQLSEHTSKFFFACNDFEINPWMNDIRQLGKHMRISHISQKKVRLYTLVLSQTEARIQRRRLLGDKSKAVFAQSEMQKAHIKALPLIIKKYDSPKSQTFSSFVHSCPENTEGFLLEGPFGTGFGLTPKSTGLHVIFAAGTGVFPFLDLFDFLLESAINREKPGNIFRNGFKLQIFLTFGSIKDFVGLDILEKLIQSCNENGMEGAVKMTVRLKEAECSKLYTWTNETFDEEFLNKYVGLECEKVYVCGPPAFNQKIPAGLEAMGINSSKIILA